LNFKQKKIIFIDFDTIFSAYLQNRILKYDKGNFSDLKLILPRIETIRMIFKDVIDSLSCNSILIIDSLNGLIDSLNMLNLLKIKNKEIKDKKKLRYKSAGYQSLNILFLLLKKIEHNKIPIVVTAYLPLKKSNKLFSELLSSTGLETNHFSRISNSVLFLEFDDKDYKTVVTILKNNQPSSSAKSKQVFHPYSIWHYYNFFYL
jgi:hypothetical protein